MVKDRKMTAEEEWVNRRELELLKKIRAERDARIQAEMALVAEAEREKLKKQHWMCCPKCGHEMEEKELFNVLVDICTMCEGIYFDRGELEELLLFHQAGERASFFRRLLGLRA